MGKTMPSNQKVSVPYVAAWIPNDLYAEAKFDSKKGTLDKNSSLIYVSIIIHSFSFS